MKQQDPPVKLNYNKYSMGKKFRKAKGLRKADPTYIETECPPELQEYIDYLRVNGLLINKVKYGIFKTKNGLPYPGLVATEKILANEVLVNVPRELLFTTRDAFLSPIQEIFLKYPQFYSQQFTSSHEDHMLLAFLLYEWQRGRESPWYNLIQNLPRDIDYLIYWKENEIALLQDHSILRTAQKQRSEYELECRITQEILSKYPQYFKQETLKEENIRWFYTHLVTRCFGKYLNYVTMVPFCELFNHECTDVYYDYTYKPDNPNKKEESVFADPVELDSQDEENATSSDGSYQSDDELSDNEYEIPEKYNLPNSNMENKFEQQMEEAKVQFMGELANYEIKEQGDMDIDDYQQYLRELKERQLLQKKAFNTKQSLQKVKLNFQIKQKEIYLLSNDIKQWIFSNIDYGDSFSLFFINQIYQRIEKSLQEYFSDKKAYFMIREDLKRVQQTCVIYKNELFKYNKDILKKSTYSTSNFAQKRKPLKELNHVQTAQEILAQETSDDIQYFAQPQNWQVDKFDTFIMKCGAKDQFEKHAQVYFCYGRLSNRMMLMRYGMALEYNKYDHVHIRVEYLQHLIDQGNLELLSKLKDYEISKFKRFKIKYTSFPIDLILYCKAVYWQYNIHSLESLFGIQDLPLEIKGLELSQLILENFLKNQFKESIEENEALLTDKSLGYHQYFAVVYRIERQRILILQIKLIKIAKEVMLRMHSKGISFEIAGLRVHDLETGDEFQSHRLLLAKYFDMIKFNFYIKKQ